MREAAKDDRWHAFDDLQSAIPGGTSLHPAVLRNMQRPYVNPWSDDFVAYFEETLVLLKRLYNTSGDVLVMTGPIRMAMDAVVCSLLEPGEKAAAVAVNGHWGELFTVMARAHGAVPLVLDEQWGTPIDPDVVRRQLDAVRDENVKALFVTHVETSTGIANPVEEIGEIARERGLLYVVDAAQTLGGAEVRTDDWGIDFCISGNHKCMSAPAGLSYVAIGERGWKAIEGRQVPIQAWYTNLLVWREVWMRRESGYFTFPVSLVFGLRAALDLMFDMGLPELYRRYEKVARAIRAAARAMGLELVAYDPSAPSSSASEQHFANTVTAIRHPAGIRHEDFARLMQAQYGLSIAGTYGPLAGRAFRVGPTGLLQIQPGFTMNLIGCMGMAFRQLGFHAEIERSLAAANEILATA